ncbi:MAG TPA: putative inorganic carbon transporter subunit DabA, partial [Nitrospiraceae bacterium]|nr:putative inorganic carbon transporter subunit DabA [Nitrospiraceae bacterium]
DLACRRWLKSAGDYEAIRYFIQQAPYAHWLRRRVREGHLPPAVRGEVAEWARRHKDAPIEEWNERGRLLFEETAQWRRAERLTRLACRLIDLAAALGIEPKEITQTSTGDAVTLCDWLDGFPPSQHGPRWLEALETHHCRGMVGQLLRAAEGRRQGNGSTAPATSRPLAQMVFCIDVRSEVFRRHLERLGGYETLGVAGFFGVPVKYQPFGGEHPVTQAPVLLKPKNHIREIPRSYHGAEATRHRMAGKATKIAHTLLYDLKQNVVTPYVMVEALGWLFGLPLLGKTLFPLWYQRASRWFKKWWLPPLATTLTIDKLTRPEAEDIVAADHRALIRAALRREFPALGSAATPALIETMRRRALGDAQYGDCGDLPATLGIPPEQEEAFIERLRQRFDMTPRGVSNRLQRITQHGFSLSEQAYAVEAALRLMGFTGGFARLVVICAHGSTSDNNPYESALDCGACGGNSGLPNARAFAAMANSRAVRDILQSRGVTIPSDTHFVAARHDTTADDIRIVDLEDVPPTHRKDLVRLISDLEEAGQEAAGERGAALEGVEVAAQGPAARTRAARRAVDWAQVRPEWGLSRNNALVIGRRELTIAMNLQGRAFLHSYDHRQDESGKLLETIMTAPLVVAQWINMEHYFSTVDNEVYGSGSKVYHNVVGRVGVMSGAASDLRLGLPAQTVLNGPVPYHEPMRLLTIIEAPRGLIESIIAKHPVLERLIHNEWVLLMAYEPGEGACYRYDIMTGWQPVRAEQEGEEAQRPLHAAAANGADGRKGQPQPDAAVST